MCPEKYHGGLGSDIWVMASDSLRVQLLSSHVWLTHVYAVMSIETLNDFIDGKIVSLPEAKPSHQQR